MAINVRIVSKVKTRTTTDEIAAIDKHISVKTDISFPNWLNDLQSVTILQKDLAQ
jgi:hypothetical protein